MTRNCEDDMKRNDHPLGCGCRECQTKAVGFVPPTPNCAGCQRRGLMLQQLAVQFLAITKLSDTTLSFARDIAKQGFALVRQFDPALVGESQEGEKGNEAKR